jgi:hypothetical protein
MHAIVTLRKMLEDSDRPVYAAYRLADGRIFTGQCHEEVRQKAKAWLDDMAVPGYFTSKNRFLPC